MTARMGNWAASLSSGVNHEMSANPHAPVATLRHRSTAIQICLVLSLIPLAWFLGAPSGDFLSALTQGLTVTLFDTEKYWISQLVAPVNTIAGLAAIGLLVLRAAYRKIFA